MQQDLVVVEVTEAEAEDIIAFSSNESLFMRIYVCVCVRFVCYIGRTNEDERSSFAFSDVRINFFEREKKEV